MKAAEFAKDNLASCLGLLSACAAGMDDAQYNWKPAGTANAAAKSHVHALTSADFFINGAIRGKEMVWTAFAAKNDLPAQPMGIWTHEKPVPHAAMQDYAKQLTDDIVAYVGTLSDDDLDREVETQFFGKKSISFLVQLAAMHAVGHGGDIATVKGIQGLKGLPF